MANVHDHRRWLLPAQSTDWLIVSSLDTEARTSERTRVPEVFVTSFLDRWLATPAARTLDAMYETLGGHRPLGLTGLERSRYEQRLKQRLEEAFARGELVALQLDRPTLVPPVWPEPPKEKAEELVPQELTFLAIELKDESGKPVPNARYVVTLPDGSKREGTLNANGHAREDNVVPGQCQVSFPELDGQSWS
ncbi:carboxypeptidase regulatory-like domain-containing protein [Myxococcaceae bacterium JPH2]|nr:carboxypeptidase regulatory-like domain-containing protein [Myxococcaceae bacterium JPH2]